MKGELKKEKKKVKYNNNNKKRVSGLKNSYIIKI